MAGIISRVQRYGSVTKKIGSLIMLHETLQSKGHCWGLMPIRNKYTEKFDIPQCAGNADESFKQP